MKIRRSLLFSSFLCMVLNLVLVYSVYELCRFVPSLTAITISAASQDFRYL